MAEKEPLIVELSLDDVLTIVSCTYLQYTHEKDDAYKKRIKAIHNKLGKFLRYHGWDKLVITGEFIGKSPVATSQQP